MLQTEGTATRRLRRSVIFYCPVQQRRALITSCSAMPPHSSTHYPPQQRYPDNSQPRQSTGVPSAGCKRCARLVRLLNEPATRSRRESLRSGPTRNSSLLPGHTPATTYQSLPVRLECQRSAAVEVGPTWHIRDSVA